MPNKAVGTLPFGLKPINEPPGLPQFQFTATDTALKTLHRSPMLLPPKKDGPDHIKPIFVRLTPRRDSEEPITPPFAQPQISFSEYSPPATRAISFSSSSRISLDVSISAVSPTFLARSSYLDFSFAILSSLRLNQTYRTIYHSTHNADCNAYSVGSFINLEGRQDQDVAWNSRIHLRRNDPSILRTSVACQVSPSR